ncbi:MAG TPA: hypothetical protein DEF42_04200 [Desulfosporosinus sp.]|nr:hypothetical protein [Desulfosporosinus sp.]
MNSLLLLILLFLIGIVIISLFQSLRSKITRLLSWRLSAIIAGLYLGFLAMLVPILYLLPANDFIKTVENKEQAISNSQILMNDLYNQKFPSEEDLAKLEGVYKNSSHTFKVDSNKLSINLRTKTGSYHVLIQEKDVDDNEINVSAYVTAQYMGEVNFTKQLAPPAISLKNGILFLTTPNYQTLEFKQFNSDFTVDQFKHQNSNNGLSTNFGEQIIYIHVPKNLEINRDGLEDRIQLIGARQKLIQRAQ